ncbi:hypothetical protein ACFQE4_00280 [Streptomyces thermocoprophilus]|uniref:Teneurin-like YD-shell domain-containing protein n=1 Tax=Streptomyces thermocoprophilus TaxID=78356 RepID=A0ABV5VM22_9ACTN
MSSWATACPGSLSIGGQMKPGAGTGTSYKDIWLYVIDEAGNFVLQQEIERTAADDPAGAAGRLTLHDKVGNRLTSTRGGTTTGHTYDAADQLTSTTTGTTTTAYAYDGEGNRTKAGTDTYSYDLAGHIAPATVAGHTCTYDHDAAGNQIATAENGTVTGRNQWHPNAPLPLLAGEYDGVGALKQSYRYDPLGQPAATESGSGALFHYHHDTQGSPVDVTDSTGTLLQRWAYAPFGTRVLDTTADGAPDTPRPPRAPATSPRPATSTCTPASTTPPPAASTGPTCHAERRQPVRLRVRLRRQPAHRSDRPQRTHPRRSRRRAGRQHR